MFKDIKTFTYVVVVVVVVGVVVVVVGLQKEKIQDHLWLFVNGLYGMVAHSCVWPNPRSSRTVQVSLDLRSNRKTGRESLLNVIDPTVQSSPAPSTS